MVVSYSTHGGDEKLRIAYNIIIGRLERKRPLGRLRCRWEGNIEIDVEI
jgi:hypothetical protein